MGLGEVRYGDAFVMSVTEGNLEGTVETEDLGLVHQVSHERELVRHVQNEVQEYGGAQQLYICIPIARVWTDDLGDEDDSTHAPNRVVSTERAETDLERMARAAIAMGMSDAEGARRSNIG